jgi:hypothetical protein
MIIIITYIIIITIIVIIIIIKVVKTRIIHVNITDLFRLRISYYYNLQYENVIPLPDVKPVTAINPVCSFYWSQRSQKRL